MKGPDFLQPVLDFHTHAYPERVAGKAVEFLNDYYRVTCEGDGTIGDLKQSASDAGVTHLLVHAVATRADQVENVNSWIGAHIGGNLYGFGTIHPQYEHTARELARVRSLGLLGIKLHPDFQAFNADDPAMDEVYGNLEGELPVLFHSGDRESDYSSPLRIAAIARRFPRLTVIAAHLGGFSEWDEAEQCLKGDNVYVDTSSSITFLGPERARALVRHYGAEHVLFGTDYPLTRHSAELERFFSLGLTDAENEAILFKNGARLLGILHRQGDGSFV